jgi:transposase
VNTAAKTFTVKEVSADKAYTSYDNFDAVGKVGGQLFAAFKENTTAAKGGLFEKAFHWFSLNKEDYLKHYHKRSNVESTFSAVKRVLGDSVKAKTDTAMKNEVLAKFVCHNIRCVVSAIYELGIDPVFLGLNGKPEAERGAIIRFPGVE